MAHSGTQMRLAVLGAGKMGGILIEAFVKQGLVAPQNIFATVQHAAAERKNGAKLPVTLSNNNRAAAKKADVIFLCVKPQTVGQVVDEIRGELNEKKLRDFDRGVGADRLHRAAAARESSRDSRDAEHAVGGRRGDYGDRNRENSRGRRTWRRRENFSTRSARPWSWTKNTWTR